MGEVVGLRGLGTKTTYAELAHCDQSCLELCDKYKYNFNHNTGPHEIFIFGANAIAAHFPGKMISVLMLLGRG